MDGKLFVQAQIEVQLLFRDGMKDAYSCSIFQMGVWSTVGLQMMEEKCLQKRVTETGEVKAHFDKVKATVCVFTAAAKDG